MKYLFIGLLLGIPFSPFIFKDIDIWNAQGLWFQVGLLVCFCCSFYFESNRVRIKNIPLGLLVLWGGSLTIYISYQFMAKQGRYSIYYLFPFLNLLYVTIFYKLIVQYLNKERIKLILKWLSFLTLLTLFLCTIQAFGLGGELYNTIKGVYQGDSGINDLKHPAVIGFIGNPTHLSAYLGMCLPFLFLFRKPWLSISLLFIIIMFFTNYASYSVPMTGILTAIVTLFYYLFCRSKRKFIIGLFILLIIGVLAYKYLGQEILSAQGRIGAWKEYWTYIKPTFIFGRGLGANKVLANYISGYKAFNHLHNEYLQGLLEMGLIGLLIIIYGIWDFFKFRNKSKEEVILKAVFLGFLVQSFTLFPAHLWMMSSLAIFSYGCIHCLKNEEIA